MPVWLTAWITDILVRVFTPIITKAINDLEIWAEVRSIAAKQDATIAAANQLSLSKTEKDSNEAEDALARAHNS